MSLLRLIARLDIKGSNVVKGIHMEGLRVIGKPEELAKCYAEECDELLYMDTVASLYGRNQLSELLERTTDEVFVPITVGGGVRSRADVRRLLESGADKVAINTAAIGNPALLQDCVGYYGSQAIVLSIEAKKVTDGWEAYTDCGRERTGKNAIRWAFQAVSLGIGEILLTSIDQEGTRKGFDLDLIKAIAPEVPVPVIACGGMGSIEDAQAALDAGADALAMASVLHYKQLTMTEVRNGISTQRKFQAAGRSEGPGIAA